MSGFMDIGLWVKRTSKANAKRGKILRSGLILSLLHKELLGIQRQEADPWNRMSFPGKDFSVCSMEKSLNERQFGIAFSVSLLKL